MESFLVAKNVNNRFEKVCVGQMLRAGDISLPLTGDDRREVESAIRFVAADKAVNWVDTVSGFRVSRTK